jgi:hypothetical protein
MTETDDTSYQTPTAANQLVCMNPVLLRVVRTSGKSMLERISGSLIRSVKDVVIRT